MHTTSSITCAEVSETATKVFNGFILSHAIFALWQGRVLDHLQRHSSFVVDEVASEQQLDPQVLYSLCQTLSAYKLVRVVDRTVILTETGRKLIPDVGPIIWAVGGYGDVLSHLGDILLRKQSYGENIRRSDKYVVQGSALAARRYVLPHLLASLDEIRPGCIVDLGCGSGRLLIELCQRYEGLHGIGVDVSEDACRVARQDIAARAMSDRIEIICSPCQAWLRQASGDVPLRGPLVVTCLFMMHDLMADWRETVTLLSKVRGMVRPTRGAMLIADDAKTEFDRYNEPPIFSLGFALTHSIMGVSLWDRERYEELFAEAGLEIAGIVCLRHPSTWLYKLR